jgi:hypothetical protein
MGHGGARRGAGRKSKADEDKVVKLAVDAIKIIYGSEQGYFEHLAKESKGSFPHLKLLHEYAFGKVPEVLHNINEEAEAPILEWEDDIGDGEIETTSTV